MTGLSVPAGGFIMFSMLPESAQRPEVTEIKRHRHTLGSYSIIEQRKTSLLTAIHLIVVKIYSTN